MSKTNGDVRCHDPDDASPMQPITITPKAKEMDWHYKPSYKQIAIQNIIFFILMNQHLTETTNLSINDKLKKSAGWQPWSSQKTLVSFPHW